METSNSMSSTQVRRLVTFAAAGVLLVVGAYLWGNRLNASSDLSVSQASQYASLRVVAGARAVDAAAQRAAAPAAALYAGFRGVAAVRAADAAQSAAGPSSINIRTPRVAANIRTPRVGTDNPDLRVAANIRTPRVGTINPDLRVAANIRTPRAAIA